MSTGGGIAAIQARIAGIQAMFPRTGPQLALGQAQVQTTNADFASVLAQANTPAPAPAPVAAPVLPVVPIPTAPPPAVLTAPVVTAPPMAAPATPTTADGSAVTGQRVVEAAAEYLGVPYVWGGTDPTVGLDCSGLVQRVYADLGIVVPRVSRDQAQAGRAVESLEQAQPGDLIAFGEPVDHIGIYLSPGRMIVAPRRGEVVEIQDITREVSAIRRILPDATAAAAAAPIAPAALPPATAVDPTVAALSVGDLGALGGTPYDGLFTQTGQQYGISPQLLSAVAKAESAYNPQAVSHAGAQGLMQLMPATAAGLGVTNSFDPAQAVPGAARLLAGHLRDFGSVELALAAYNAGPGAVRRHGGIPPYAETQNYVTKILGYLNGAR